jgi:hypothetical protein
MCPVRSVTYVSGRSAFVYAWRSRAKVIAGEAVPGVASSWSEDGLKHSRGADQIDPATES